MDPVIGVFALQGDVREHLAALAECDAIARPVRRPSELESVDALVIPGGESTTMSNLAITFDLFEPIAARIRNGMPVYGSCAGMIMLATNVLDGRPDQRTFAGIDMTVRRNAFGRQVDSFEADVVLDGLRDGAQRLRCSSREDQEPFHAVFIRAPWVEKVGDGVTILGRAGVPGANGAGRIVAVQQGNLLATAFHPELTGDLRVHRHFVEMVRESLRLGSEGSTSQQ